MLKSHLDYFPVIYQNFVGDRSGVDVDCFLLHTYELQFVFYCRESIVKTSAIDLPYYVDFVIGYTGFRAGGRKQTRTAYIPPVRTSAGGMWSNVLVGGIRCAWPSGLSMLPSQSRESEATHFKYTSFNSGVCGEFAILAWSHACSTWELEMSLYHDNHTW